MHRRPSNRIGAIQHDQLEVAVHALADRSVHKVAEDGLVGVEADASVLQVDDYSVEVPQVGGLGPAVCVGWRRRG